MKLEKDVEDKQVILFFMSLFCWLPWENEIGNRTRGKC